MSLLITLGIVGGLVLLVALYCLGLECAAWIVGTTQSFGKKTELVKAQHEHKAQKRRKKLGLDITKPIEEKSQTEAKSLEEITESVLAGEK